MNVVDHAIAATVGGDTATLTRLLDDGLPVSTRNAVGNSLLHMAISQGHTEVVRVLLQRGADVRTAAMKIYTPLVMAVCRGNTEITGLLIDYGADPENVPGRRPPSVSGMQSHYCIAIDNDQVHQVTYLERRGWEPFDPSIAGVLFHELSLHLPRKYAAIDFLIARGAEPWRGTWRIPDIFDRLVAGGLPVPPDMAPYLGFQYTPQPMTAKHPLWKAQQAIERLGPDRAIRPATPRELVGFASYDVAPSVLEFFAHFTPAEREAIPNLQDFDGMMLQNGDFYPSLCKRGYFVIGSDFSGDAFTVGRELMPGHPTPPVFCIDHEKYSDDSADESLSDAVTKVADDLIEFIEPLIPSEPDEPPEEQLVSTKPCSRCGSMESMVLETNKNGQERFCSVCGFAEPFTG